jgi:putative multicomponent Na+:H+ antiporter subunit B
MDSYIYIITALLPVTAGMVVLQVNPYHALIMRGILGAVAAMIYAVLGAADVALTEALVGTMLAITLYAVAVRSSLVMRLGVLPEEGRQTGSNGFLEGKSKDHFRQLTDALRTLLAKHHMRLELVCYTSPKTLQQALLAKEVHATCAQPSQRIMDDSYENKQSTSWEMYPYQTQIRVHRLYEILQAELSSLETTLIDVDAKDSAEGHL